MSIAQRCAGVLTRWARERSQRTPIEAGVLKRSAETIDQQEFELDLLRKVHAAAVAVELAHDDPNFARRCGGIRKLRRELSNEVWAAEEALVIQDCRNNPN